MGSDRKISRRMLLGAVVGIPLFAEQEKEPFNITDNVNLVLLDVSVRDTAGGYVTGLVKDNFKVFDSGRPVVINQFARMDAPVTVGLILDDSGSMRSKRPSVVMAGLAFAKESNPLDEFFVVNFNDEIISGLPPNLPFTDRIQPLHEALYLGEPAGKTRLYDAVAYGLRHLEKGHRDQRTLIVVSDGGDNASQLSLKGVTSLIEESRATIYTVGLLDPDNGDFKPAILRRLSNLSGGEYFQVEKTETVIDVLHKIALDVRSRYTLGFTPDTGVSNRLNHAVKVLASAAGKRMVVRSRTSYSVAPAGSHG